MRRKNFINIPAGELYSKMEDCFIKSITPIYNNLNNQNAFYRFSYVVIKSIKAIIDSNKDKTIFYFKDGEMLIYFDVNQKEDGANTFPLYWININSKAAVDIINNGNSCCVLSKDNLGIADEIFRNYIGNISKVDYLSDFFSGIFSVTYNTIYQSCEIYFKEYKTISSEIYGFKFIYNSIKKHSFKAKDIKFFISLD